MDDVVKVELKVEADQLGYDCVKLEEETSRDTATPEGGPCNSTVSITSNGISPRLLKTMENEISKPVTLIINQCLNTYIFPTQTKSHYRSYTMCWKCVGTRPPVRRLYDELSSNTCGVRRLATRRRC